MFSGSTHVPQPIEREPAYVYAGSGILSAAKELGEAGDGLEIYAAATGADGGAARELPASARAALEALYNEMAEWKAAERVRVLT